MNNLRNLRKKRGLSLKDIHDITGYPVRTLEDWDANKKPIQAFHRIKKLAEVLKCDIDDLMIFEQACTYNGEERIICMIQEEDGIHVSIFDEESERVAFNIVSREETLAILKLLKNNREVSEAFKK